MRRFYQLRDDVEIPRRWHIGMVRDANGAEPRLRRGLRYDGPTPLLGELTKKGRALDYCLTSFGVSLANQRLADGIQAVSPEDVQQVPILLDGEDAALRVLNVLRLERCLDEKRSQFSKWTKRDQRPDLLGHYRQVIDLHVIVDVIPEDAQIFRIDRWEVALIVSETMKAAMEKAGCKGALFTDVT